MTPLENFLVVIALCATLTVASYKLRLLDLSGSVASFFVGAIIGIFGSFEWLLLLIAFTLVGFAVTRFKLDIKTQRGLQEGRKGERTWKNVVANGFVPAAVALCFGLAGESNTWNASLVYLTSISVAASDTIASELGVLSRGRTLLITTFKPVPPGTDGGISALGTLWAFIGALFATVLGWTLIFPGTWPDETILVPIMLGFAGCIIDSIIGATLERSGKVSKLGTNVLSMAIATIIAAIVLL